MKTLVLTALSLALALPASAASAPKKAKPKTRTLDSLIKIAMKTGKDKDFSPYMVEELGIEPEALTEGHLPVRVVFYKQAVCPDEQKHVFHVAYRDKKDPKPQFLIFSVYQGRKEGETLYADGYTLRADLKGRLEKIVSIKGVVKQADHKVLDPKSDEAQKVLEHEIAFYTRDSIPLEMDIQ